VHYYVLVSVGMDAQVVGQFLPPITEWGVPPFVHSSGGWTASAGPGLFPRDVTIVGTRASRPRCRSRYVVIAARSNRQQRT
jgi:hypothetical protein